MRWLAIFIFVSSLLAQKTIIVGVGLSLEPYIIKKNNTGIELDIVKTALQNAGYKVKVKYLPFLRIPLYLKDKKIDAATTINEHSGIKNVYYSDRDIYYQNVVVTLKSSHLNIKKVSDLKGLRVIGFQNSDKYLGKEFRDVIPKLKLYQELANQRLQVKLLFAHRVDAIILDVNIFKYIRNHLKDINTQQKVVIFEPFAKTYYKVGFLDKNVRDKYNIALRKMKKDGKCEEIFHKYIK
ncbi:MAG: amino acid ABC transporter substrate-binding protein [Epsilonproteobacteria bacterium]|nr:amino acid ABC transporter substrate-binding protein [Campylobacterota bacterium]